MKSQSVYQRRIEEILSFAVITTKPTTLSNIAGGNSQAVSALAETEDYAGATTVIQNHCEGEWPDDFSMRAYCIEQQERALAELKRGRPADIPEDIFHRIRNKCAGEWPKDFTMR